MRTALSSLPVAEVERHFNEFREDGYTILQGAHPPSWVDAIRGRFEGLRHQVPRRQGEVPYFFDDFLEFEPNLSCQALERESVLQVAERIIGPQVQLESMTLSGAPPAGAGADRDGSGKPSGWHRDLFARIPQSQEYQPPLLFNAMCYLQDLSDANGPLRVLPGSHRRPSTIASDRTREAQPGELLLYPRAGDVVIFHHALLHSGTENRSPEMRLFCCVAYNLCWLKHRADFSGPVCQALKASARAREDRRFSRLLDDDDLAIQRVLHNPVLEEERVVWQRWMAEDQGRRSTVAGAGR
jgi:hypothetical protein